MSNSAGNWKRNKRRRLDCPLDVAHEVAETECPQHSRVADSSPSHVSIPTSVVNHLSCTSPETSTSETLSSGTMLCGTVSPETLTSETASCGTVSPETLTSETASCGTVSHETLTSVTASRGTVSPETLTSVTASRGTVSSGELLSGMNSSSEVNHSVEKGKKEEPCLFDRDVCYVPVDEHLLSAANSESFTDAVALLTSENSFTQEGLNQALISACRRGHKLLVQKLVRAGADTEYQDEHGNTPLLICAENGFTDIVRFLVSRQANVNAVNYVGNTALILSIRPAGSTDLTRLLLEQQDVDILHENQHGHTALIRAIQFMDVDTMILLLQTSMKRNNGWQHGKSFMIGYETEHIFFSGRFQEMQHRVAAAATGLRDVFKILTDHLITRTSPLELAIEANDTKSLDIFLDCQFSSKEQKKKYIDNALMYMFKESRHTSVKRFTLTDVKIIKRLLQYGANVNQGYRPKLTALAVESGNFQLVELLCTHGADVKRHYSSDEDPMCIAAKNDRRDLIELLLKFKADVNSCDYSDSPLDYALRNGHTDCAKLLIQHGAQMNVKYALRSAVDHQKPIYINFLLTNYGPDVTDYFSQKPVDVRKLLTLAAEKGNLEIIGQILDAGVGINEENSQGQTALMASKNGEVADFLIQRGADVSREIAYREGIQTALTHVISHRQLCDASTVGLCKVLIDNGAEVNRRSGEDKTPLMMAASRDDCVIMLQMLLDNDADVNDKDSDGNTALMHALLKENSKNVTCLINFAGDKKSLINIQNNEGLTPLILSVQKGNVPVLKELIEKGADVNIKDNKGNLALHHLLMTCPRNRDEILTSLLEAGSHVNCQNSDGLSPLMLATKKTMVSMMSPLLDAGADINAVSSRNNSQTALSFLSNSHFYPGSDTLLCIVRLLDRGARSSYLSHECLHNLILANEANIIFKLIQHGIGPAEVQATKIHLRMRSAGKLATVSPLCVALLAGHVPLARYFMDILFLTSSDLCMFAYNKVMERLLEQEDLEDSLDFLHELSSQPMSLVKLCLVTVSAAVGSSPGRETRVDSLPLPQMMKDRLLFKSIAGEHAELAEIPSKFKTVRDSTGLITLLRDLEIVNYVDSDDDDDDDDYHFYASDSSYDIYDVYYDSD